MFVLIATIVVAVLVVDVVVAAMHAARAPKGMHLSAVAVETRRVLQMGSSLNEGLVLRPQYSTALL